MTTNAGCSTQSVHAGELGSHPFHSLTTPIVQTSVYVFDNTAAVIDYEASRLAGLEPGQEEYGRYGNPTQHIAETKLAALDGGEAALLFASGMGAITTTLLALLSAGDHLVLLSDCYRRTRQFAQEYLSRFGIQADLVAPGDLQTLEAAVRPNTRLIFGESPTNPYLRVLDLPAAAAIAHRHGLLLVVDSTFATPCNQRPLEFGVDLVIHSATKYLGGHNDLLAGVIVGRQALIADLKRSRDLLGGVSAPHDAYLLLRGLKTLGLRVQRHNENGLRIAAFLEGHPKVRRVFYPGLTSHPDHAVARRQMRGFGGVVSFEIDGEQRRTAAFVDALRLPHIGPSLGGVESLVIQPAVQAYYGLATEQRLKLGIADSLVRYALGIEDPEDLLADLAQALDRI
jgi:cystathionine gamma-synthase